MRHQQRGMSSLGILTLIGIGGFFLTCLFKIGPIYLDNYFVSSSVNSMNNVNVRQMSNQEIRKSLQSYFDVNNVRNISAREVEIVREKDRVLINLDYEKRVNLMGNLDVVVVFKDHYDSSQH